MIRRHGQHTAIMPPHRPARHPSTAARGTLGWTTRPASANLEPVTAPAGARAAHLSPQTRRVTTRSGHAAQFRGEPRAAKTQ